MRVLATKLHLPPPRPGLVPRPRLGHQLRSGDRDRATLLLLSAPAGFGKTTALSQWLATEGRPDPPEVAWVSLDAGDNDARRFLSLLVAALQRTNAEVGRDAAELLDAPGELSVEAVLTLLVNDLDTLAAHTVIALDDVHELTGPQLHEALAFLVDHLPHHVRLAVATRADPPLPLARLRSTGRLVELRAADLRFSTAEARTLLNDVMGLDLAPGEVEALDERTEGWAAGLQLAGLSMRGRHDVAGFVDDFAGSHRFVLDYLVEEVLDRQPDAVRDFLLATSVLGTLTAPLCAALTGRPDAQTVLEALERDNVFVVPLDDRRTSYRYHHLFADALQARLASADPARAAGLHRRACRWYAEHGGLEEALLHAAAGQDHVTAAELVEIALPALRRTRHDDTIRTYLARVPTPVLRRRPLLALMMAWSRLSTGDLAGVEAWLEDAERASNARTGSRSGSEEPDLAPDICPQLRGWFPEAAVERDAELRQVPAMTAVYRASVAQARGDVAGTRAHATRARLLSGPEDHLPRGAASGFLGLAAWAAGDVVAALDTFGASVDALTAAGDVADALGGTAVLARIWLARGRPDEARRLLEQALADARSRAGPLPTTGDLHVALADVLREQDELGAALTHLDAADRLGDAGSLPEHRHRRLTTRAGVLRAQGDLDGALALLDEGEPLYQPGFLPDLDPIPAQRARLLLAQGRLEEADAWARAAGGRLEEDDGYLGEFGRLTLARLLVARAREGEATGPGGLEEALALLDRVVRTAAASERTGSVVEAGMVRALALAVQADDAAARVSLSEALALGVPAGYRRLFLDEGRPMVRLLHDVVGRPRDRESAGHAAHLLSRAVQRPTAAGPGQTAGAESLSAREREVLQLLVTDLSGPQIARHLFVSLNTLRTHTKHIYTKLGVTTRRAAVRTALERGLLPGPATAVEDHIVW